TQNGRRWAKNGGFEIPAPDAPSLVCFDKHTGKVVWKDNSPGKDILYGSVASPTVIEINGRAQIIAPLGDGWVRAFDPSSGKLLWKFDTNPPDAKDDKESARGTRNGLLATAVFHENRLYIGNCHDPEYGGLPAWLYCIDPSKSGDISPHLGVGPDKGKLNP